MQTKYLRKVEAIDEPEGELRLSPLSPLIQFAYRFSRVRKLCVAIANRLEGGDFYSATKRMLLKKYHGVSVGAYSYGECMVPGSFPMGVKIGRYVSIASGVRVLLRNHPLNALSTHPFFFNSQLGFIPKDTVEFNSLEICDDAWIGANAIVTPGCSRIGIGAVVGAGSVVTKDIEDFAIVAGNPARLIRYRFSEDVCERIRSSRWWERPVEECTRDIEFMQEPLEKNLSLHPLLNKVYVNFSNNEAVAANQ